MLYVHYNITHTSQDDKDMHAMIENNEVVLRTCKTWSKDMGNCGSRDTIVHTCAMLAPA